MISTAERRSPLQKHFAFLALFLVLSALIPALAFKPPLTDAEKLAKGEVIVGLRNVGNTRYVTGTILLDQTPDQVWPVMVNPYEFQGKISPRMKTVDVMLDKEDQSIMKVTLDLGVFIPNFTYTVDSRYTRKDGLIAFKRLGGTLKDFSGTWEMKPADNGNKTELTYSMFVDPGFFVPQWIMREGVKVELPTTLTALRKRLDNVYLHQNALEPKSILAARGHLQAHKPPSASSGGVSVWQ
ncbi:MAG TPA: SRPBCC family protein [Candidatus Melainabacteria bacterium]|nr:SRPBCC family protein [Candidatus Melainabacteria bacterium]